MDDDDDWLFDAAGAIREDLNYSDRLDVHRWTDHKEAIPFINNIYDRYFAGGYRNVTMKNLKVVVLDLFVKWKSDPNLKTSYSRNSNDYQVGSIYNELHISRKTIDVVDKLSEVGLVKTHMGFKDRRTGVGRISRMWPTRDLIKMFEEAAFSPFDIGSSPERVPIVLRNDEGEDIAFEINPEL
ncbi:hypothetical protein [Roseobacter ponti]|uniref:Uncharacterized protein n=1 Tax=Roseobacter ponti TaxID=1891787 RepID=A0A858ST60_9RHOB|nr:hypothetical protein [Roseobacter ponti]QJF50761.1 hypothetical protein G3256_06125 [Roseobacter ponti]